MLKTIVNNKQVFYLCPTTILSKQQYENAIERFKNYPIEIALLNRFTTPKEAKRIIEGLKNIKYDAYVLGNHEFNYGLDYLSKSYGPVSNKILNANIEGLQFKTKPYRIFEYSGFRIACIGFTTSFIPNWEQECNIKGLVFNDPVEIYAKYEEELKEKIDEMKK